MSEERDNQGLSRKIEEFGLGTRLSHLGRRGTHVPGFVNPPLIRGSTVLAADVAERRAAPALRLEQSLVYGICGSETHHALENMVASIEGGANTQIVSTGLAACTIALMAYLKAGDHCLMPDSCYGPVRHFCDTVLSGLGIETTYFPPEVDADALVGFIRPQTRVLYLESPGSQSFEIQDVPALAAVCRPRGIKMLMDNTWGFHFFQPFAKGIDVSIQALTKYAGGHSDLLIGSITTASAQDWERVRYTALAFGQYASPDDCWLTLRGLRTLKVRLETQMRAGLEIAAWLRERPEVLEVRHPGLPGARGHELWKRDFSGAASLFAIVFRPDITSEAVDHMVNSLQLFGIGASWGGFESLIVPLDGALVRTAGSAGFAGSAVRIHVGLEDTEDLKADMVAAFKHLG